jgi:alkaline phosphatase D
MHRRRFLQGLAAAGVAGAAAGRLLGPGDAHAVATPRPRRTPTLSDDPFRLGVASGDPRPNAVVLWTRLALDPLSPEPMPTIDVPVTWEIARDERFSKVIADGEENTGPDVGHSVHVDARGLEPDREYWYRFRTGGFESPVGRTRTAPARRSRRRNLRFAVTSCQAYQGGYYTAYEQLSRDDLAFVVFLGDYIYELAPGSARSHGLDPAQTLDEFRRFYAIHHADPQLQVAHGALPWVATWDDHEVEDNYAGLEPGAVGLVIDPDAAAKFPAKRAAAYRAWWENMPVRGRPPSDDGLRIYRALQFGRLLTLAIADDRQYRSPVPSGEGAGDLPRSAGGGPQLPDAFDPRATMLGRRQERWLERTLADSDTSWNVLAQQTIMAQVDRAPDDDARGFSMDAWDGYVAARNRLLDHVHEADVSNFVTVGGDIHTSAVTDVHRDFHREASPVVGTELIAPPVSSLELLPDGFVDGARRNPHIHLYDTDNHGYLRCEMSARELRADFVYVSTIDQPTAEPVAGTSWVIEDGRPGAQPA